ncbi:unnamed protein product [Rotaria sp. Silwood2]|nr:unnamed protein product [Rotaria sp. Silwood2]CAF2981725.1 unnamed protein product [Rotaria sp. Silwood2]CAF3322811.1 unnamed protein product [Rotaria sp. Silwood2]CAF3346758.1 unnamed protein product [Rotaria sp. Silwood2]CAF4002733.1 unnamed protein product [Rotaria sp. Silwood2]
MERRCNACKAITPSYNVKACPSCRHEFHGNHHRSASSNDTTHKVSSKHEPKDLSKSENNKSSQGATANDSLSANNKYFNHPGPCSYKNLCAEFLKTLEWNEELFDRKFNRCYCLNCYSKSSKDSLIEGGSLYVIPRGWCRFGLHVDPLRTKVDHIWKDWIVTYHGTTAEAAQSVVTHGQFLVPGDKRLDGKKIAIGEGHIPEKYHIYTSPTMAYSGHPCYCRPKLFRSNLTHKVYNARVAIQCRQKPGTFMVQGETIGAGNKRICQIIPNSEVELYTTVRASVVPYGLLIHLSETT